MYEQLTTAYFQHHTAFPEALTQFWHELPLVGHLARLRMFRSTWPLWTRATLFDVCKHIGLACLMWSDKHLHLWHLGSFGPYLFSFVSASRGGREIGRTVQIRIYLYGHGRDCDVQYILWHIYPDTVSDTLASNEDISYSSFQTCAALPST